MSFHDFREAFGCYFSEDLISEEEVLILHEEYQSGDCFPLWQYEPFNVANFDSSEA